MSLLRLDCVSLDYGEQALLRDAELAMEAGERVCLVGRNGAGKSSLLKLLTGELQPDGGAVHLRPGLKVSALAQSLPEPDPRSVFELVAGALEEQRALIVDYERRAAGPLDARALRELEQLQHRIEAGGGWHVERQVHAVLDELDLDPERAFCELSGGWRRRALLARALVDRPDLLLLDEPTNHLDLGTIAWLESRLLELPAALLFISHDRAFIRRLATRIVEIDRGRLTSWPGRLDEYQRRKEKALLEEEAHHDRFDKKLAEEEAWIREGIKARRTRNEGRVRALEAMRERRSRRRQREGTARLEITRGGASGRKVIETRGLGHGFGEQALFAGLDLTVQRGDRVGIIGNNGVGKSTLLAVLLGHLAPREGSVKLGSNLQIAYFDQLRSSLDPDKSVAENVADGRDFVKVGGQSRHVVGYMGGFLFSPSRTRTPVRVLSGGERNRVILAKLLARPANLLVLDEPTNDLDIETLEVLEARLVDFEGTILMVSHDRDFLDNVVTSTLVFESDGGLREYPGGYSDWERRGRALAGASGRPGSRPAPAASGRAGPPASALSAPARGAPAAAPRPRKLSYREQRELDELPGRIEALEHELGALQARVAQPGFYQRDFEQVEAVHRELARLQEEVEEAMQRWGELEALAASA